MVVLLFDPITVGDQITCKLCQTKYNSRRVAMAAFELLNTTGNWAESREEFFRNVLCMCKETMWLLNYEKIKDSNVEADPSKVKFTADFLVSIKDIIYEKKAIDNENPFILRENHTQDIL